MEYATYNAVVPVTTITTTTTIATTASTTTTIITITTTITKHYMSKFMLITVNPLNSLTIQNFRTNDLS